MVRWLLISLWGFSAVPAVAGGMPNLLQQERNGLCALGVARDSELRPGDFIVGPGDLHEEDRRRRLLATLATSSRTPMSVTVLRDGVEVTVAASRRGRRLPSDVYEAGRTCGELAAEVARQERQAERELLAQIAAQALAERDARALRTVPSAHTEQNVAHALIDRPGEPRIFARRVGTDTEAPVLIVVNGGPGKSSDHMRSMEVLVDRGWSVVTYDQRATGFSHAPDDADHGFEAHASDLDAVRDWTGHDRVFLLGHSWGGPVILDYASRHPERVLGAAVVGSAAVDRADFSLAASWTTPPEAPPAPESLDPSCIDWWPNIAHYYPDPNEFEPEHLAGTCHTDVLEATYRSIGRFDLTDQLQTLEVPVLLWYGEQDRWSAVRQPMLDALPLAEVTDVLEPGCGHRPMFQCPEVFYPTLEAWLREHVEGQTR